MASDYPGSLDSFTSKTDKEDLYEADHINELQNSVVAIETELGTDPAGSKTDLVTRLAQIIEDNGALNQGTSFPGTPVDGQIFYRTDQNTASIYNGSTWDALGQSLSNAVFIFGGSAYGTYLYSTTFADTTNGAYARWKNNGGGTTYQSVAATKFTKISSIQTVTIYIKAYTTSSNISSYCQVDIGGQTGTSADFGTVTSATWQSGFDVDVSGLSDGTNYDVTIKLKNTSGGSANACFTQLIGIAS